MGLLLTHPARHKMFQKNYLFILYQSICKIIILKNFAVYVLYKYSLLMIVFIDAMMNVESLITSTTNYHIPGEPKVFLVKPFFFLSIKSDLLSHYRSYQSSDLYLYVQINLLYGSQYEVFNQ